MIFYIVLNIQSLFLSVMRPPFLGVYYKLLYYIDLHKWIFTDRRVKLNLYEEICVCFFSLLLGNDKPRTTLSSHPSSHHWPPLVSPTVRLLQRDVKIYVFMNCQHRGHCMEFPKSMLCYLSTRVNWAAFPSCLPLCDKGFFFFFFL